LVRILRLKPRVTRWEQSSAYIAPSCLKLFWNQRSMRLRKSARVPCHRLIVLTNCFPQPSSVSASLSRWDGLHVWYGLRVFWATHG